MKKLYISLKFSKSLVTKSVVTKLTLMLNYTGKFGKILEIHNKFAGNRVDWNEKSYTNFLEEDACESRQAPMVRDSSS